MNQVLPLTSTRTVGSFLPTRRCRRVGQIKWARFMDAPPKRRRSKMTAAMKAGVAYEEKVGERLSFDCSPIMLGMWFCFRTVNDPLLQYCQTDIIIPREDRILLIEVKLRHCLEAWHQLFNLYLPVYKAVLRRENPDHKPIHCVEITRWFDPLLVTPQEPHRIESLEDTSADKFNVLVMK